MADAVDSSSSDEESAVTRRALETFPTLEVVEQGGGGNDEKDGKGKVVSALGG